MSGRCLAALGLEVDPMRAIWNGMSERDKKIIVQSAGLVPDVRKDQHQDVIVMPQRKTWDELTPGQKISVRHTMKRFQAWCQAVGIVQDQAAA